MKQSHITVVRPRGAMLAVVMLLLAGSASRAADEALRRHPGYVDGSSFSALAAKDDKLVEVSIKGTLLSVVSAAFETEEPELAQFLKGIQGIHAVVAEPKDFDAAHLAIGAMASDLEKRGWERIALVRDENELVHVYTHSAKDLLDGLTVMVRNKNGKVVFANIAGIIDLARLAQLGDEMDIPGLDHIPGARSKEYSVGVGPAPATPHPPSATPSAPSPAPKPDSNR